MRRVSVCNAQTFQSFDLESSFLVCRIFRSSSYIKNPTCNFLVVFNTNLHPISYRFKVIADYCSHLEENGHFVLEISVLKGGSVSAKISGRMGRPPPFLHDDIGQ